MKNKHYTELVDESIGVNNYTHRTLRTCFDPSSHEWTETIIQKKIEILQKVITSGNDLQDIVLGYKRYYNEMNKPHVGEHIEDGLIELLKHLLTSKAAANKSV